MSSDSVAARREARKRRILENSENRLSKILSCDSTRNVIKREILSNPEDSLWEHSNGAVSYELSKKTEELLTQSYKPIVDSITADTPITERSLDQEIKRENIADDALIEDTSDTTDDKTQTLLQSDFLFIVLLSILVRLMYQFNLSSMFADSLFIPFATISIAKLAANPMKMQYKSSKNNGMMRASLLLSGVSKNVVDRTLFLVQLCKDIAHDFALYMFAFIITHVFFESFVTR